MDILKAANKVGSVASQVMASAVQQRQLETERKVLQDLRAEALSLRAQIGEEIFKQWKAGRLPSSGLDGLLEAVDSTSAAISRQRRIVDQLLARPTPASGDSTVPRVAVAEEQPVKAEQRASTTAAPELLLDEGSAVDPPPSRDTCATCGASDIAGRRFCGFCGTKIA
jgi:hypothetical protein